MCSGYPQVSVAKEPIGVKEPLSDTVAYLTKHQIIFSIKQAQKKIQQAIKDKQIHF